MKLLAYLEMLGLTYLPYIRIVVEILHKKCIVFFRILAILHSLIYRIISFIQYGMFRRLEKDLFFVHLYTFYTARDVYS